MLKKLKQASHRVHNSNDVNAWWIEPTQLNLEFECASTSEANSSPCAEYEGNLVSLMHHAVSQLGIDPHCHEVTAKLHKMFLYDVGNGEECYTQKFVPDESSKLK